MCSLKCTIPGVHLKVFGRAIQSLSKIGDELYFEPLEDGLYLRAVNLCRSAYGCFQFSPSFFSSYIDNALDKNKNSEDDEDILRCKLGMKSILAVFKSLPTLDKTVEKCRISLDSAEARLVFRMYCRHGIVKTHKLAFTECDTLQAVFSKEMCPNKLTAVPKLLCDAVLNFQNNQEEVTLIIRPDFMALKNYVDDEADPHKVIHTELTLSPEEFEHYQAGVDADVTFCLREFRAVLAFADITGLPVTLQFETAGRPITFSITSDLSFEANFVLATLAEVESSELSTAAGAGGSVPRKSATNGRVRNGGHQHSVHSIKNPANRNSSSNNTNTEQENTRIMSTRSVNPPPCSARDKPGTSSDVDSLMDKNDEMSLMMDVTAPEESISSQLPTATTNRNVPEAAQQAKRQTTYDEDEDGWNLSMRTAEDFLATTTSLTNKDKCIETHGVSKEKGQLATTLQQIKRKVTFHNDTDDGGIDTSQNFIARPAVECFTTVRSAASQDNSVAIQKQGAEKDATKVATATVPHGHVKQILSAQPEAVETSSGSSTSCGTRVEVHSKGRAFLSLKSSTSGDGNTSPVIPRQDMNLPRCEDTDEEMEEEIPATPPSKKFRSLFFGTQSSTQSTQSQQKSVILAPDSDEEN